MFIRFFPQMEISLQNYYFFCIFANFFVPLRDFMRLYATIRS